MKTKGKAKERPKNAPLTKTKEGRKLGPLVIGSYLTHIPSSVAYMQIMKFNNNKRSRRNIARECNLLLYSRG
jgi:hypothetical protein